VNLNLIGILEDGSPPVLGQQPLDPRTTIRWTRGENVTINLTVKNTAGQEVSLAQPGPPPADQTSLLLTVKKRPQDSKVFDKTGTLGVFTITPADTKNMEPGRYVFDIWLTKGGKRDPVVPLSTLLLEPSSAPVP